MDEELRSPALAFSAALLAIALLVLLIACFNVAGMLLARGFARSREVAIRLALGSSRLRVVRSLLAESLLLSLAAGGLGLLLAAWLGGALEGFERNFPIPLAFDFGLDLRVLLFALSAAVLTGLAFGILPALQLSRPELVGTLKESPQGAGRRSRLQSLFVAAQVAGSAILLVTGGLFLRTLANAADRAPGFELEGIYVAPFIDLSLLRRDPSEAVSFYSELIARLESLPDIEAASATSAVPLAFAGSSRTEISVPDVEPPPGEDGFEVDFAVVTPGFLRTLSVPLERGRAFDDGDGPDAPRVALVNQTMARRFWGTAEPLGRRFELGGSAIEVVGVVADTKYRALSEAIRPFFYLPNAQQPRLRLSLLVRSRAAEAALATTLREEMRALEPDLPALPPQPLRGYLAVSLLPQRLAAAVGGVLGFLGACLAGLGVYGIAAFAVARRVREIGIRVAIGADRADILRLITGQGLRLSLAGSSIGLLASLGLTRLLRNLLYGVSAADPLTYAAVAGLLLSITLIGSWLPARRAARLDPLVALRHD